MPKAEVTLKEGASYHLRGHVFTSKPSMITSPEDIAACKGVSVLMVREIPDEPPPAAKPAPEAAAASTAEKPKAKDKAKGKAKDEPAGEED